jgi:phosphate acetyltransferase
MGSSVYVASVEGTTGKSTVALGVLHQLSRRVGRVAVFRPIVRADTATHGGRDYVLDLLISQDAVTHSYDDGVGVTYEEVHHDPDAALDTIVQRYRAVAEQADAVVVVGSDYTDVGTPTEFSFNAKIAANLGAPVLLVLNGFTRTPHDVRTIAEISYEAEASLTAVCRLNKCWALRGGYQFMWMDHIHTAEQAYLGNAEGDSDLSFDGWHAGIECRR